MILMSYAKINNYNNIFSENLLIFLKIHGTCALINTNEKILYLFIRI